MPHENLTHLGFVTSKIPMIGDRYHSTANKVSGRTVKEIPFIIKVPEKKQLGKLLAINTNKPITSSLLDLKSYEELEEAQVGTKNSIELVKREDSGKKSGIQDDIWASEEYFNSHLKVLKTNFDRYLAKCQRKENVYVVPRGVVADPRDYSEFYRTDFVDQPPSRFLPDYPNVHPFTDEKPSPVFPDTDVVPDDKDTDDAPQITTPLESISQTSNKIPIVPLNLEEPNDNSTVKHQSEGVVYSGKNRSRFSSKELSRKSQMSKISRKNSNHMSPKVALNQSSQNRVSNFSQQQEAREIREQVIKQEENVPLEIKVLPTENTSSDHNGHSILGDIGEKKLNSDDDSDAKKGANDRQSVASQGFSVSVVEENSDSLNKKKPDGEPTTGNPILLKKTTIDHVITVDIKPTVGQVDYLTSDEDDDDDTVEVHDNYDFSHRENRIPFHIFKYPLQLQIIDEKNSFSTLALYARPIGLKSNEVVCTQKTYHSYWKTCIERCLESGDLQQVSSIGYYSCFSEDELAIDDEAEKMMDFGGDHRAVFTTLSMTRKVWIDLLNEAIELSYIYAFEVAAHEDGHNGYSFKKQSREFMKQASQTDKKIEIDKDLSKTCTEMVLQLDMNDEDQDSINPSLLLSPELLSRKEVFWQGRRLSMAPFSSRSTPIINNIDRPRKSVVIVHHKDRSVKIIHPAAAD